MHARWYLPGTRSRSYLDCRTSGPTALPVSPVPGGNGFPTDTNGDGLFDDVNGNGRRDFADVVLPVDQMTRIAANEPADCFDTNGNGRVAFADVVRLSTIPDHSTQQPGSHARRQ